MTDLVLEHDGWMVVADGEKALFLFNEGDEMFPNLKVFREFEHENPPSHAQGTDKPGRMPDASQAHKSAVQDTDWHRMEKERFGVEICERLYKYAHAHRYRSLILVAPPQVLGGIRKELHSEVADKMVGEVAKDLTGHPVDKIESLLLH